MSCGIIVTLVTVTAKICQLSWKSCQNQKKTLSLQSKIKANYKYVQQDRREGKRYVDVGQGSGMPADARQDGLQLGGSRQSYGPHHRRAPEGALRRQRCGGDGRFQPSGTSGHTDARPERPSSGPVAKRLPRTIGKDECRHKDGC